jgi:hypothetical protein
MIYQKANHKGRYLQFNRFNFNNSLIHDFVISTKNPYSRKLPPSKKDNYTLLPPPFGVLTSHLNKLTKKQLAIGGATWKTINGRITILECYLILFTSNFEYNPVLCYACQSEEIFHNPR